MYNTETIIIQNTHSHSKVQLSPNSAEAPSAFVKKKTNNSEDAKITDGLNKMQSKEQRIMNKLIKDMHRKEQQKRNLALQHMKEIFVRLRTLIESLWEEMNIKQKRRDKFMKKFFYPETLTNYMQVYQEITRLCKIRSAQHVALKFIEQREVYIRRIKELSKNVSSQSSTALLLNELPEIIVCLRETTVKLIDAIIKWRQQLPEKQVFDFQGQNYILTMQTDMDFLKTTEAADFFDFLLDSNPLLLPNNYRWQSSDSKSNFASGFATPSGMSKHHQQGNNNSKAVVQHSKHPIAQKIRSMITMEHAEKYKQTDRIIFQEEMYIEFIRMQRKKHSASIIVQCFVRRILSYKMVIVVLAEKRQKDAAKASLLRRESSRRIVPKRRMTTTTSPRGHESLAASMQAAVNASAPISEEQSKRMLDEYLKQNQMNNFLGSNTKMNGRYAVQLVRKSQQPVDSSRDD